MNLANTFNAARSTLAANPDKTNKTIGYYLAFIALGLTSASLGPTLPGLAAQTRSQLRDVSFLFTARSFGYLVGSVIGGRLYDRRPGHPVIAGMLMLMALMMVLVPTVPLLWLLTVILFVIGLAEGAVDVGGNTLLVWVYRHEVGPFMNGLHFFFGVGAFLSPIIVAQALLLGGSLHWAYWALALLVLPISFWLLRVPSPASESAASGKPAGPLNRPLVGLFVLFLFLYVGAEVSFGGWIYTYAVARDISIETAALLTSAFWGALTVGRLLAIPIAARFRPRFILLSDLVGGLASMALILLWPGSELIVWIGTLGMGLSLASIFPMTISLAERRMVVTGQITGLFFVGASAGAMSLPWLIGQMFESVGSHVVMLAILIDLALAVLTFMVLISRSGPVRVVEEG